MREYVSTLDLTDRLNLRDCVFGGTPNAIKLNHECTELIFDHLSYDTTL